MGVRGATKASVGEAWTASGAGRALRSTFALAVAAAVSGTALIGVVLEISLLRKLYARDHLSQVLATLLFSVEPTDGITFVAVSMVLVAVAAIACLVPARRAASVDPMVALRVS